jgi:hypothetical protein
VAEQRLILDRLTRLRQDKSKSRGALAKVCGLLGIAEPGCLQNMIQRRSSFLGSSLYSILGCDFAGAAGCRGAI